tara:strand:+ start:110 stop:3085 length:2976 start_codon:yes stop_codon:yes gene_type:complete
VNASDPRKAYNALAKYFGMHARDTFLDPLKQTIDPKTTEQNSNKATHMGDTTEAIFGQGLSFKTNAQMSDLMKAIPTGEKPEEVFCVTTMDGTKFDNVQNIVGTPGDQGYGTAKGQKCKLSEMLVKELDVELSVIQVFPIATGLDVTDTEIAGLFLNSLYTQAISQAVPFLDVRIVGTPGLKDSGNFENAPSFSLGKFLSAGPNSSNLSEDDPMLASFLTDFKGGKEREGTNPLSVVAGMEVFTTPQTLVDATSMEYSRATAGRIDVFRPFMAVESLEVSDIYDGGGTISYKSASMKLKLFDKGRMNEIAEFVAPRRDPNIKFEITYGWSHPDGTNFSRPADADVMTRVGRMIDSMRVTEVYTLTNSSFTINREGVVDIDLTLTMDGSSALSTTEINSLSLGPESKIGTITVTQLVSQLDEIKNSLMEANSGGSSRIELPMFVQSPDIDSVMAMDAETLKSLTDFIAKIKKSKNKSISQAGTDLWKIFSQSGNSRSKIRSSRDAAAKKFVARLELSPDPFLRPGKAVTDREIRAGGVTKDKKRKGNQKQKYVSYGKLVSTILAETLGKGGGDLQLVFSSFNHNAAGVYDYNLAQFPIQLKDFLEVLQEEMKKRTSFTVDAFIKFISDKFLTFDGAEAFGRDQLTKPNERTKGQSVAANKTIQSLVDSTDPADKLKLQSIERKNLKRLYGGRVSPTFTKPRVNMRLVTKKAEGDDSKNVTRVYFQDQAAGRLMSTAEALMTLVREGSVQSEDYKGAGAPYRGPKHNDLYQKNYGDLTTSGMVGSIPQEIKDKMLAAVAKVKKLPSGKKEEIEAKINNYKVLNAQPGDLRKFFFENSPYLLHGTEGSGIIEAALSSEADENLTNIFLASRYSGKQSSAKTPQKAANLPYRVHPGTLSITTFGCPFINLTQKYFIDFGTNTTLDNYYVCTSVGHVIGSGDFKTNIEMKPYDAYGAFVNVGDAIDDAFIKSFLAENGIPPKRKKKKKKKKAAEKT